MKFFLFFLEYFVNCFPTDLKFIEFLIWPNKKLYLLFLPIASMKFIIQIYSLFLNTRWLFYLFFQAHLQANGVLYWFISQLSAAILKPNSFYSLNHRIGSLNVHFTLTKIVFLLIKNYVLITNPWLFEDASRAFCDFIIVMQHIARKWSVFIYMPLFIWAKQWLWHLIQLLSPSIIPPSKNLIYEFPLSLIVMPILLKVLLLIHDFILHISPFQVFFNFLQSSTNVLSSCFPLLKSKDLDSALLLFLFHFLNLPELRAANGG